MSKKKPICKVLINFADDYQVTRMVYDSPDRRCPILLKYNPFVDERFYPESTYVLNLFNIISLHGPVTHIAVGCPDQDLEELPF